MALDLEIDDPESLPFLQIFADSLRSLTIPYDYLEQVNRETDADGRRRSQTVCDRLKTPYDYMETRLKSIFSSDTHQRIKHRIVTERLTEIYTQMQLHVIGCV